MALNHSFQIFIVDDDPFSLAIYEQHLRNLGFVNICTFDNARACINQIHQKPALVFAGLGQVDGVSLVKEIKSFDADIYVIFLSVSEDPALLSAAFKSGAFACIQKAGVNEARQIAQTTTRIISTIYMLKRRSYKSSLQ